VFDNFDWLVFGGGEPLLDIDSLSMTINHIIFQHVKVSHIFISTNGCCHNIDSDEIMELLLQIKYLCCNDLNLQLSNTRFHRESRNKREEKRYLSFKEKLNARYISYSEYNDIKYDEITPEGRAVKNKLTSPWVKYQYLDNAVEVLCKDGFVVKFLPPIPLYLSCEGDLIVSCHAYNNRKQFFIANINEFITAPDPQALLLNRLEQLKLLEYKTYEKYLHEKEIEKLFEIWYQNHRAESE
jgi:hypothetical protein